MKLGISHGKSAAALAVVQDGRVLVLELVGADVVGKRVSNLALAGSVERIVTDRAGVLKPWLRGWSGDLRELTTTRKGDRKLARRLLDKGAIQAGGRLTEEELSAKVDKDTSLFFEALLRATVDTI